MIKLILVILVRTFTDISFKAAVNNLNYSSLSDVWKNLLVLLRNPFLYSGLFFGASNVVLWLAVLKDFDLSYAYPFLSASTILVMLSGKVFFDEHLDRPKLIGLGFISLGVICLIIG